MDAYIAPHDTHSEATFYSCIKGAAEYYRVPAMALLAIYAQEQGPTGKSTSNTNRSKDYGRFQINDQSWAGYLSEHRIALERILRDNCLNAYVGAHIFQLRYRSCQTRVWCAIGLYHSANEPYRSDYVRKVYLKYQLIQSNSRFLNWYRALATYHASTGNWTIQQAGAVHATTTNE